MIVFASTVATLVYTLSLPKIYKATTTLLPPMGQDKLGGLGMDIGQISQFAGGLIPTPATPTDVFVAMLKSRTMASKVVDQFGLKNVYKATSREAAIKKLKSDTRIKVSREKVISISVESTSPQLTADIANYYVEQLDRMNRTINITATKRNRMFIEDRLKETKVSLIKLEDALEGFQTKHRTVSLEHQAQAAIDAAANLQASLTAAEVRLQVMENFLAPNNPDVIKQQLEIKEMGRQLKRMQFGSKPVGGEVNGEGINAFPSEETLNPAFVKMPALGLDLARLTREVKVQETLYTLLTSQYEQAKIQEARDTPTVQVLDEAVVPEKKIRPKNRRNVVLSFITTTFLSFFLAFFLEYVNNLRSNQKIHSSS